MGGAQRLEVLGAVALFGCTLVLDRAAYRGTFAVPSWVISGSADAARQILTAIAAAVITVVGVVFSIILVTRLMTTLARISRRVQTEYHSRRWPD